MTEKLPLIEQLLAGKEMVEVTIIISSDAAAQPRSLTVNVDTRTNEITDNNNHTQGKSANHDRNGSQIRSGGIMTFFDFKTWREQIQKKAQNELRIYLTELNVSYPDAEKNQNEQAAIYSVLHKHLKGDFDNLTVKVLRDILTDMKPLLSAQSHPSRNVSNR